MYTSLVFFLPLIVYAQSGDLVSQNNIRKDSFEQATADAWINIKALQWQSEISRYEITRLLNAVECKDCINPDTSFIDRYTNNFWTVFTVLPGKDFDDIDFQWWMYNNQSYYYCVASVGDREYMYGYPILSSPTCPGQFCGKNSMTKAEFIQVVINIISNYIAKDYSADRKKIKIRKETIKQNSYASNVLNSKDKEIIDKASNSCNNSVCTIKDRNEFRSYLKYCMFNIKECNMKDIGRIKQWYRPVAEINIALQKWFIEDSNIENTIHKPVDGAYAISVLSRIFPQISCTFDNDYDCDRITNKSDNCPNHYNPNQRDSDRDGIGDVCDDDIDGDKIKNPIGIVDANNGLNTSLLSFNNDNCIFVPNQNQIDNNQNTIGDVCEIIPTENNQANSWECKIPIDENNTNNNWNLLNDPNNLFCRAIKKLWKTQCDQDKDGIDDRCDDDVDGDGVKNLIWLIVRNSPSCTIIEKNIDNIVLQEHFQWSCRLDNCPWTINTNQEDNNKNKIWEKCEDMFKWRWNNGNSNENENNWNNNNQSGDNGINNCKNIIEIDSGAIITVEQCKQCPCQYADENIQLKPWDTIRASLWDMTGNILQARSEKKSIL